MHDAGSACDEWVHKCVTRSDTLGGIKYQTLVHEVNKAEHHLELVVLHLGLYARSWD